ncbi:hypothetical protein GCM10009104_26050 [Marinobacterium maritimum]|uniref:Uncharacterized protein n=1 Tax=Marinobacterium maritimum TaxID=500162 RepID=A0ABN1I873_9GAMM
MADAHFAAVTHQLKGGITLKAEHQLVVLVIMLIGSRGQAENFGASGHGTWSPHYHDSG